MFQKYFHKSTNLKIGLHETPNIFYSVDLLKDLKIRKNQHTQNKTPKPFLLMNREQSLNNKYYKNFYK